MESEETQSHGIPSVKRLLTFGIDGMPKGWKRARGQKHRFMLTDYEAWKHFLGDIAKQEIDIHGLGEKFPYKYPLSVSVMIYIPNLDDLKSFPDLDNILKGVCDGLTGIVYPDDKPLYVRRKVVFIMVRPTIRNIETWFVIDAI